MSRTDLDPATLARSLRRMAGDGSIEWVMEPIQASVLLDVADMLAENAKLRTQLADVTKSMGRVEERCAKLREQGVRAMDKIMELGTENDRLRELCAELLRIAESNDPDFLHWPEIHNELRKLGVEVDE